MNVRVAVLCSGILLCSGCGSRVYTCGEFTSESVLSESAAISISESLLASMGENTNAWSLELNVLALPGDCCLIRDRMSTNRGFLEFTKPGSKPILVTIETQEIQFDQFNHFINAMAKN